MKVLNDSGRQCCKENGVPIKCLGMCSGDLNDDTKNYEIKQANHRELKQIGSCEKHLNVIIVCQEFTKGIILIFLHFCYSNVIEIKKTNSL